MHFPNEFLHLGSLIEKGCCQNLKKLRYVLLILLIIVIAQNCYSQENSKVSAVIIRGLMTISEESIKPKLEIQPGVAFSSKALKNDIQRLHQLGLFANLEVQVEQTSNGVQVTFLVTENQLLGEIKVFGNHEIGTDEILRTLRITQERYLASHTLSLDIQNLTEMYRKKGYLFANIKTEKKPSGSWIDLHIIVDEGPEVTIRSINFFGNKTFTKGTLLDPIKTQESALFSSQYFDEESFQEDLLLMRNYYRSEGFLDVRLHLRDIMYSTDRTEMDINIVVEEGERYTVDAITFEGNKLFTLKEIETRTNLRFGSFFRQNDMLEDKSKIEKLYGENGFLDIKVQPLVTITDVKKTSVNIHYKIQEGTKTYIRKIEIKGNSLTQDNVIRREVLINPGEQFHLGKLEESQSRIRRLNYFETIKVDFMDTDEPNWKDLLVSVEEGRTGNLRFAAGITSDLGAVGEISFTKRNFDIAGWPNSWSEFFSGDSFTGAGQTFDSFVQIGKNLMRFRAAFTEPYLFGTDWSLGIEAYSMAYGYESYDEERIGSQISIGRRLTRDIEAKVTYKIEGVGIVEVEDVAPRDVFAVKGHSLLSTLTFDITLDTRDDFILATRGYIFGISYETAGVFLGGDYDFSKFHVRTAWFNSIYTNSSGYKHVLSLGLKLDFATAHSPSEKVPIFERYFAGGSSSLRGFAYRGVSPRENYPGRADDPIGGNFMLLGTVEYSIPIYEDVIRVVVFTDFGSVVKSVNTTIFDTMRASVGFGFRVKIPFFGPRPFAFDFGFPLMKEDGDDTRVFSFSFGKPF